MARQENKLKASVTQSNSDDVNHSTRMRDAGEFDLAIAYVLGEASVEERYGFEAALATGDEEANDSYANASKPISELSAILLPEDPPPFAKERVMARVREGSITYFMPPGDQQLSLLRGNDT